MLTLSVLLSAAESGGKFVTYRPRFPREPPTPVAHELGCGDALLISSEDIHNVTPVGAGERHALVIEMWVAPSPLAGEIAKHLECRPWL